MTNALTLLHRLTPADLPAEVRDRARMCLLDLVGVGTGGATTRASAIIRDHAADQFPGPLPMLWDGRGVSASGMALAGGMTIDALDGHDGFNPAKGHAGCGVLPAALALGLMAENTDGAEFLCDLVIGYEYACRLAMALHGSVPDYHTSGAWVAVAVAAIGARRLGLNPDQTRHALGIAEYHGPRSQMMRCIDSPTMVKDGSGWGAMAGVSAAFLARSGFTGAPALTVEEHPGLWADLGQRWLILEQYFKPYPVCRWAQPPIEAVLSLRRTYSLTGDQVMAIEIETFHEATRLATATPRTTEEAQYSTSFPAAVALSRGQLNAADISDSALSDPEILRLSRATVMREDAAANAAFPGRRLARATLTLRDGRRVTSDWMTPRWDAADTPTSAEIHRKFHSLSDPVVGPAHAARIEAAVENIEALGTKPFVRLVTPPIRHS